MKKTKRIISLLLVVISLFTITAVTVSAASTSKNKVASYNAISGGTISSCQYNYQIKGNALSEKKITIKPCMSKSDFVYSGCPNSYSFYINNAYFNYKVFDSNGKLLRQGQHRFNESFKLPKGSKNYKVQIWSFYQGYQSRNTNHQVAAIKGTYKLTY